MALGTLLDRGHALLTRLAGPSAGVAVRYVHYKKHAITGLPVVVATIDITAESGDCIEGRVAFVSRPEGGSRVEFGDRVYIIKASALWFGEPAEGDRIIQEFEAPEGRSFGPTRTYEIMPTDTGDKAWSWSDPQRQRYRIRTKLVKTEP